MENLTEYDYSADLREALKGSVSGRIGVVVTELALEVRDQAPQIGIKTAKALIGASLVLPSAASAANQVDHSPGTPFVANHIITAPKVSTFKPKEASTASKKSQPARISTSSRTKVEVRNLYKGDTIWNEDEEIVDQRGGDLLKLVKLTEKASNVFSERQAEKLPIKFKVIIPLPKSAAAFQIKVKSLEGSDNRTEISKVNGGTQYKYAVPAPVSSSVSGAKQPHPEIHGIKPVPKLNIKEPTAKSTHTLPSMSTLPLPKTAPALKVKPFDHHKARPNSASTLPEIQAPKTVTAITNTAPASTVQLSPPIIRANPPTIESSKPQPTSGANSLTVKNPRPSNPAHLKQSHSKKHHAENHIPAITPHKVHHLSHKAHHNHTEHPRAHHHKIRILSQKAIECTTNTKNGHLFGANIAAKVINYFNICDGYSYVQAAGITGALQQESGLDPRKLEGGGVSDNPADAGSGGYGLDQVTPGIKIKTYEGNYSITGPVKNMRVQLEIISAQMKGHSPTGFPDLDAIMKRATSTSTATALFTKYFEGPLNGGNLPRRILLSGQALQNYLALQRAKSHPPSHYRHKHLKHLHKHKHHKKHHAPEAIIGNPPALITPPPPAPSVAAPIPAEPAPTTPAPTFSAPTPIVPAPTPPITIYPAVPPVNSEAPPVTPPVPAPTIISSAPQPETGKKMFDIGKKARDGQSSHDPTVVGGSVVAPAQAGSTPEGDSPVGNIKLLEAARRYQGIYYTWGGGHEDPATYNKDCPDPTHPANNEPTGGPYGQNPSSCSQDCSSIIYKPIYDLYGLNIMGVVSEVDGSLSNPQYFKELSSINLVGPGDIATRPGHVEWAVNYDPKSGILTTFGQHEPYTEASDTTSKDYFTRFFRYIGPGASTN